MMGTVSDAVHPPPPPQYPNPLFLGGESHLAGRLDHRKNLEVARSGANAQTLRDTGERVFGVSDDDD